MVGFDTIRNESARDSSRQAIPIWNRALEFTKSNIIVAYRRMRVMKSSQTKLYVGCSLTHAPEDFKTEVEGFKELLRKQGNEVFDFVGLENGTAEDVYRWDIGHCVRDCDVFIAICDHPALGLGWEIAEATRLK